MAEKDAMLRTANAYAAKVDNASDNCLRAGKLLNAAVQDIEENWWGNAGCAMGEALSELGRLLNDTGAELASVGAVMRSQANTAFNNWPEEEVAEDGG